MSDVDGEFADFVASGRSGRRNALVNILGSPAGLSTADLPLKLADLSVTAGTAPDIKTQEPRDTISKSHGQMNSSSRFQERPILAS
ncbi:unnamed protein product [Lampetra planeri]